MFVWKKIWFFRVMFSSKNITYWFGLFEWYEYILIFVHECHILVRIKIKPRNPPWKILVDLHAGCNTPSVSPNMIEKVSNWSRFWFSFSRQSPMYNDKVLFSGNNPSSPFWSPHQCPDSPLTKLPFSMFDPETERQLCLPVLPCTVTRQLPWGDFSLKCRRFAPPVTLAPQQLATQVQNFVLKMSCSGVFRWVLGCVLSETC